MNARGTRRPHARRPRPKARKPSRSSGGGGKKGGGICSVVVLAPASVVLVGMPLTLALVGAR